MTAKQSSSAGALDTAKLLLAVLAVVAGLVAYYYFQGQTILLRLPAVLLGLVAGAAIAATSAQGRDFIAFMRGARVELRKVVWPKRQETFQTTLIVLLFAITMGIFFWVLDLGLGWGARLLTGRG
ncbi:MAG: preprotein translocase subunit SecE [Pseudomonadota bacterium]